MTPDAARMTLKERFSHLFRVISGERFLKKQGLGNEIPFFICSYAPQEALELEKHKRNLVKKLEADAGVHALEVNLYDLSIALLKDRDIWERVLEMETSVSKSELKELLQGVLDPAAHLVPAIAARMQQPHDVLFLSGVGEVFPYIRSHNVLNNLQSTAKEKPTVMFFPGAYTHSPESGASLDLFGRLHDDKYYRAFNIFHCEA
jgi:hypothetical protein